VVLALTAGIDHVKLKLDHLGADLIKSRLPGIRELSMKFAGVDPIIEPIPVVPTCHYAMGGIPTNIHSQVLTKHNGQEKIVEGLYAVGECACVSVHGANRLGGNSLLDLVVFGRAAGLHIEQLWQSNQLPDMPNVSDDMVAASLQRYQRWENSTGGENHNVIYNEMQRVMQEDFGVFRTGEIMANGIKRLEALSERLAHANLPDKSHVFNTERVTALELDNLMATAFATAQSAIARTESRGAHSREDYPKRDDENWIKHTLYFEQDHTIDYRPVNTTPQFVEPFKPKERVY
jgi:succinate dehydrogenase / fumarate reductase flavoprotein subunit